MNNNKKIAAEVKKIGILKLRIERLITNSQKKILDVKNEFDGKVNKVYTLIELSRQKIWELKKNELKDKELPEDLEYDLGIDWIHEVNRDYLEETIKAMKKKESPAEDLIGLEVLE